VTDGVLEFVGLTDGDLDLLGLLDGVTEGDLDLLGLTDGVTEDDLVGVTERVADRVAVELNEEPLDGVFV
jgi:hypothetical protein